MANAADAAKQMMAELEWDQILHQMDATWSIQQNFGDAFVYENQNGNMAISKEVLSEFRKLTEGNVVWVQSGRYWRFREEHDGSGRRQED